MKKTTKRLLWIVCVLALTAVMITGVFTSSAVSDDPADSYVKQTAANEDSTLSMWFDHSYRKTFTSDKTSTGKETYSIYMAKNEIESAQVVLYSATERTGMNISVTDFTDGKGNTVPAELYYEMYVTTSNLDTTSVLGSTASDTIIREGETPDPIVPYEKLGTSKKPATFKLNAGKSQAFLIRATTTDTTTSGWYSAQLNVYDSNGNEVKTATVYCYVWDFVIPEETALQTSFYLKNDTSYGGSYKAYYDYLLENRLNAMDVPGGTITSTNPYLTNPRVNSIRVSSDGNGSNPSGYNPKYQDGPENYATYAGIYADLSSSPNWEQIKDKLYFYTVDEAMSKEQHDAIAQIQPGHTGLTVDDVSYRSDLISNYWDNAQTVVPYHENHPYPYYTYHSNINLLADYQKKDGLQEMIDDGSVTIFCPQIYAFTPQSELTAVGYIGNDLAPIRNLSGTISGLYALGSTSTSGFSSAYVNWEAQYGEFRDRVLSNQIIENAQGENYKMWTYCAGWNKGYTYTNHLIENTGLQTKLLFWQLYQNDITGYLYYGTNNWSEYGADPDTTVTGAKTTCKWYTNRHDYGTHSIYGNGTLLYGKNMAKINVDYVGTLRVEILRDGVEEYQMLTMLANLKGDKEAKAVVSKVSTNVVNYLSLNGFSTAEWGNMDEYDIMETVRRSLGNEVEAAMANGECDHTWDAGEVTLEAGCKTLGEKTYICEKCGANKVEYIPAKHSVDSNFTVESSVEATCTADGSKVLKCKDCGYRKTETVNAFHSDPAMYAYELKNEESHTVKCSHCGETIVSAEAHVIRRTYKAASCEEDGYDRTGCIHCSYTESETVLEKTGHSFEGGVCTNCGEKEAGAEVIKGDVDNDGKLTSKDLNLVISMASGIINEDPVADMNSDGKVNASDIVALTQIVSGS